MDCSNFKPGLEGGAQYFQNDLCLKVFVEGDIDGKQFKVVGQGTSKAPHSEKVIHAYCETGKLPLSWNAISHTLLYGFPQLSNYPAGLTNFGQECYPEGLTMDRTVDFEGDGKLQSHHEFELEENTITSRVKISGSGFDPNGAIMKNELVDLLATQQHVYPWEGKSVRQLVIVGYHKKDGGILLGRHDTTVTFLGTRNVKLPNPHFVTYSVRHMKDDSDERDHIVMREITKPFPAPQMVSAIGTPNTIIANN